MLELPAQRALGTESQVVGPIAHVGVCQVQLSAQFMQLQDHVLPGNDRSILGFAIQIGQSCLAVAHYDCVTQLCWST